jgi:hypothetical protein
MYPSQTQWRPLAWIPNTSGYPLTVITHTGNTHRVRVVLDIQRGTHRLDLPEGVQYSDLKGWKA